MREIKYRGRSVENGEWVYGNLIGTDRIVGDIVEWDDDYFATEFWVVVDPETVGQLTGLKDRNGVEIYEGDVVKHHGGYSRDELILCRWQEAVEAGNWTIEKPGFRFERINGTGTTIWIANKHFEVIGNIYEHPHLISKEESQ